MKQNMHNFGLACGAAGSIVLPQAITGTWPQLFASAAPFASGTVPGCTGVCGSCGGSCIASVGALLWLGCCTYLKKGERP